MVLQLFHGEREGTIHVLVPERQAVQFEVAWVYQRAPADDVEAERKLRTMIESPVRAGKGTLDEIHMLRAVCRHQHDDECAAATARLLEERRRRDTGQ